MKTAGYRISAKAVEDLDTIWLYTFHRWSEPQANRYYALIIDEIEFLTDNFFAGKPADHIRKGYRSIQVKSHLIFYRILDDKRLEIIRILHENMDIDHHFK